LSQTITNKKKLNFKLKKMGLFSNDRGKYCRKEWRANKKDTDMKRGDYIDQCQYDWDNPVEEEEESNIPYISIGIILVLLVGAYFIFKK